MGCPRLSRVEEFPRVDQVRGRGAKFQQNRQNRYIDYNYLEKVLQPLRGSVSFHDGSSEQFTSLQSRPYSFFLRGRRHLQLP